MCVYILKRYTLVMCSFILVSASVKIMFILLKKIFLPKNSITCMFHTSVMVVIVIYVEYATMATIF